MDAGQVRIRTAGWFLLWTAVLYAGFCHDVFAVYGRRSLYVGPDSFLAFNRLALDGRQGLSPWHPLVINVEDPVRPGTPYRNYTSQFGLSGVALNAIAELTGANRMRVGFAAAQGIGLLTAALIAAFLTAAGLRFGQTAAGVAAVLTAGSPQLVYHVSSVYWCTFLLFAPFVLTWVAAPALLRTRKGTAALVAAVFVLCTLKCLCGYEYITTVVLSPLPALVYHDCRSGALGRRRLFLYGLVVAVGCAGFVAALGLHVAQLQYVLGMDPVETIGNRVKARLGKDVSGPEGFDPGPNPIPFLSDEGWLGVRGFFRYFALDGSSLPGLQRPTLMIPVWALAAATLAVLAAGAVRWRRLDTDRKALTLALAASVPCSLSWQFAARNHMTVHIHLNLIVFYLPWMLLLYVAVGDAVQAACVRVAAAFPASWTAAPGDRVRRLLPAWPVAALAAGLVAAYVWQDRQFAAKASELTSRTGEVASLAAAPPAAPPATPRFLFGVDGVAPGGTAWTFEMQRSALPKLYDLGGGGAAVLGWVCDNENPMRPVRVVVTRDGTIVGEGTTGLSRPDVSEALKLPNGTTGYVVEVPHRPGDETVYRVFAVSTGPDGIAQEMPISPTVRTAFR